MINNREQGPVYRALTDRKKEAIYLAALEVLRRTGVKVEVPEALELFRKAGCWIEGELPSIYSAIYTISISDRRPVFKQYSSKISDFRSPQL